jgi:hypothetical protein
MRVIVSPVAFAIGQIVYVARNVSRIQMSVCVYAPFVINQLLFVCKRANVVLIVGVNRTPANIIVLVAISVNFPKNVRAAVICVR